MRSLSCSDEAVAFPSSMLLSTLLARPRAFVLAESSLTWPPASRSGWTPSESRKEADSSSPATGTSSESIEFFQSRLVTFHQAGWICGPASGYQISPIFYYFNLRPFSNSDSPQPSPRADSSWVLASEFKTYQALCWYSRSFRVTEMFAR